MSKHESRRAGEIKRLRHYIENVRGLICGLEMTLDYDAPLSDAGQPIAVAVSNIVAACGRADAYMIADRDREDSP